MPGLKRFPLTAFPVENHVAYKLHQHKDYAELVIVTGGSGNHLLEHESFPIARGDVFFIPLGVTHGYSDCKDLCLINIMFDPRGLQLPEAQLQQVPGYHALFTLEPALRAQQAFGGRLQVDDVALNHLQELVAPLNREILECKPGYEVASTALLCGIMVELARRYSALTAPMPQTLVRLSALLEWLEKNLEKPITVELLAEKAHMSRSTLGRCFRECFGVSPMSYVIELRVRKAEQLLRDGATQIRDVAQKVGIDDANYFARLFRKHTGLEPSAYRSRYRVSRIHSVA